MLSMFVRGIIIIWTSAVVGALWFVWSTVRTGSQPVELDESEVFNRVTLNEARLAFARETALFIDARLGAIYDDGHIPNALHIPASSPESLLRQELSTYPVDTQIITYCSGRSCQSSAKLARRLVEELGYRDVYVFTEGWPAWSRAGFPISSRSGS